MARRTVETTIAFRRPFTLTCLDRPQAAGVYRLVTDDEETLGLSFLGYQRMATMLHTPAVGAHRGPDRVFVVDAAELAAALELDNRDQPDAAETKKYQLK
jgi:hypothetical protein